MDCTKRIQPILVDEAKIIKTKIENLTTERDELKPRFDLVVAKNNDYNKKRAELQKQMLSKGKLNAEWIDINKLEQEFKTIYPDYNEFKEEYKQVTESYRILNEHIQNYTQICENIVTYNKKISEHFGK